MTLSPESLFTGAFRNLGSLTSRLGFDDSVTEISLCDSIAMKISLLDLEMISSFMKYSVLLFWVPGIHFNVCVGQRWVPHTNKQFSGLN